MSDPTHPGAGSGSAAAPGAPVQPCTCTVTLAPKDLKICGAGSTKDVTATGTPAGGAYTFSSSDDSIATVTGNGNKGTVKVVAKGAAVITVKYTVGSCTPCQDTANAKVCTCTPAPGGGRFYAKGGPKGIADLIGAKAKIKTRYGKLCCEDEGCSDVSAFYVVYVNVSNTDSGTIWAQTGWGRERNAGSTSIKKYRYAEMQGGTGPQSNTYDTGHAPAEGSTHEYRCDLNTATGNWEFFFDGHKWEHFADDAWKHKKGTNVSWPAELFNKEDDMPGTSGSKCSFTACQHRVAGADYVDAGFTAGEVDSSDASEWGSERISATAFNIWDKKPL